MKTFGAGPASTFRHRLLGWMRRKAGIYYKRSYSQCGEDLIVSFVLETLGITRPRYLDLGAPHPYYLNNTYLFYRRGARGVNVEADPRFAARLARARKRDVTLNVGVGPEAGVLEFHILSVPTLSTFSIQEAKRYTEQFGYRIERTVQVPVRTFGQLVNEYFEAVPDLVSLDVEGLDLPILRSIDLSRYRPLIFCIETISYSETGQGRRIVEIDALMGNSGYLRYADTHINTIFVDEARWRRG
jgi:FkbM family methyltransferase